MVLGMKTSSFVPSSLPTLTVMVFAEAVEAAKASTAQLEICFIMVVNEGYLITTLRC